jgi:hypothetical protein
MVTMVFTGPSSFAKQIAPATFTPVEPPRHSPSARNYSNKRGIDS